MSESERRFSLPEKGTPGYKYGFVELMFEEDHQYRQFIEWAVPRYLELGALHFPRAPILTAIRVKPRVIDSASPELLQGLRDITDDDIKQANSVTWSLSDLDVLEELKLRMFPELGDKTK